MASAGKNGSQDVNSTDIGYGRERPDTVNNPNWMYGQGSKGGVPKNYVPPVQKDGLADPSKVPQAPAQGPVQAPAQGPVQAPAQAPKQEEVFMDDFWGLNDHDDGQARFAVITPWQEEQMRKKEYLKENHPEEYARQEQEYNRIMQERKNAKRAKEIEEQKARREGRPSNQVGIGDFEGDQFNRSPNNPDDRASVGK